MSAEVRVLPDPGAVCREAASLFLSAADTAIKEKGVFAVALSGGGTPRGLFRLLASDEFISRVGWPNVHFFWADERCVPPDNPDSNYGDASALMLSRLPTPKANIHRIKGELGPEVAASEYEAELGSFFGRGRVPSFDLILLGMGADGHTASLFPGSEALSERDSLAVPVHVDRLGGWRVTLTIPVINNAGRVVFLVTGRSKAGVVKEILAGGADGKKYPAALVAPRAGNTMWLIDKEAGEKVGTR